MTPTNYTHRVTYTYEGEAMSKTFADERSADLFIASLTTRQDAFMFGDVVKHEG